MLHRGHRRKCSDIDEVLLEEGSVVDFNGSYFDSFSRLRGSGAIALFDAQLTYDLQPLMFERITSANSTITHDAVNRAATLSFTNAAAGETVSMQSWEHFRYQPGKGGLIFETFNFKDPINGVLNFVGYSDGSNGIEIIRDNGVAAVRILSTSGEGNKTIPNTLWEIDKLDGYGPSGITLDLTKTQIMVVDFQALYVGRVRIGFDIDGEIVYVHEFNHANIATFPYIATANLPIRVGMTATNPDATTTASMQYYCASVNSEGGQDENFSYPFSARANVTAADGVNTLGIAIQPALLFNGFANRTKLIIDSFDILVSGNNPVEWDLTIGQAITTPVATAANSTYSAVSTVTGALSGTPAIIMQSGSLGATAQNKGSISKPTNIKLPLTLTAAGAVRDLGRVAIIVRGVTAAVPVRITINWREVR